MTGHDVLVWYNYMFASHSPRVSVNNKKKKVEIMLASLAQFVEVNRLTG